MNDEHEQAEDQALLDHLVAALSESTGMTLRLLTLAGIDHPEAVKRALQRLELPGARGDARHRS